MTTDAIYEERGSDWSHQVSAVGTTQWLQRDQTLPLSAKGVACEIKAPCLIKIIARQNISMFVPLNSIYAHDFKFMHYIETHYFSPVACVS